MEKESTKISTSSKRFDFSTIFIKEAIVPLSRIESKSVYDRVSVRVKMWKVNDLTDVANGKKKQNVVIIDGSGSSRCVLWEEKVGSLNKGECYLLKTIVVKEYRSKYLSMAQEGCDITSVPDIGEAVQGDEDDCELTNAKIFGVAHLEKYRSCLLVTPLPPLRILHFSAFNYLRSGTEVQLK